MKIDVGTGMFLVLGLPLLLCSLWFGWLFGRGECVRILPFGAMGPPICGGGVAFFAGLFFFFAALVGALAWYWRD